MTLEVSIEPTVDADLDELAENMRDIDKLECTSILVGMTLTKAVYLSRNMSYETFTGRVNGELVAIFGISQINQLSREAAPWLLATPLIERYAFAFARRNKATVEVWRTRHPLLKNYVNVDNTISIRWLRWLGFEFKEPIELGQNKELFYPFELRSEAQCVIQQ